MTEKHILYCSFCGKSQDEVRKMIAGPTMFICDECVDLCSDIISESGPDLGRIPADMELSDEIKAAMPAGHDVFATAGAAVVSMFRDLVEEPSHAICIATHMALRFAAIASIRVRRDLLNGTPDPRRWRQVTDDIFARALADEEKAAEVSSLPVSEEA